VSAPHSGITFTIAEAADRQGQTKMEWSDNGKTGFS
jgi:hypothetical protein